MLALIIKKKLPEKVNHLFPPFTFHTSFANIVLNLLMSSKGRILLAQVSCQRLMWPIAAETLLVQCLYSGIYQWGMYLVNRNGVWIWLSFGVSSMINGLVPAKASTCSINSEFLLAGSSESHTRMMALARVIRLICVVVTPSCCQYGTWRSFGILRAIPRPKSSNGSAGRLDPPWSRGGSIGVSKVMISSRCRFRKLFLLDI